jgi:hypothetical protein
MAAQNVAVIPKPRAQVLQAFISYAKEDEKIASAVRDAIRTALGVFANVFMDDALHFGLSFQDEIKERLDETDLLVVIYSATLKPSHGYTGMELGYFIGTMQRGEAMGRPRRIVPIYLDTPPDLLAGNEGINIGISRSTLSLSLEEYSGGLKINDDDPMVRFLAEFQEITDKYADQVREENGLPKIARTPEQQDLCGVVRNMQLSIFRQLKTNPESTVTPQKKITIRTSDSALDSVNMDLPLDAMLIPMATGNPMAIFGFPNQEISWGDFARLTAKSKFRDSWNDAITGVIISSLKSQLEIDNSQVIVSSDEQRTFRVILTTATRYFNGIREFNLYFVEYLKPNEYGDKNTTRILKGLELCCRFRFLFLEKNSEFAHMNLRIAAPSSLQGMVRDMERELNLIHQNAVQAELDKAYIWADFVDWQHLQKMSELWVPLEDRMRGCCAQIRVVQDLEVIRQLQNSLVGIVEEIENVIGPLNTQLICELTDSLRKCCSCP